MSTIIKVSSVAQKVIWSRVVLYSQMIKKWISLIFLCHMMVLKQLNELVIVISCLRERVLISDKNSLQGCGRYTSYIDTPSLIYNIPSQDKILSASCRYYDDNLLLRLEQSIRE